MANEVINETEETPKTKLLFQKKKNNVESAVETATEETFIKTETKVSAEEDFGAILEKFEQDQTVFHSGESGRRQSCRRFGTRRFD